MQILNDINNNVQCDYQSVDQLRALSSASPAALRPRRTPAPAAPVTLPDLILPTEDISPPVTAVVAGLVPYVLGVAVSAMLAFMTQGYGW